MRSGCSPKTLGLVIALLAGLISTGAAQETGSPNTVQHQGFLTDSSGNPVNGTVNMTFSVGTMTEGGEFQAQWSEPHEVQVSNGSYSVALGSVESYLVSTWIGSEPEWGYDPAKRWKPVSQWFAGSKWIQTKVEGETLEPAQKVTSTPYALIASTVFNRGNLSMTTRENASIVINSDASEGAGWFGLFSGENMSQPLLTVEPSDTSTNQFHLLSDAQRLRPGLEWQASENDQLDQDVHQYQVTSQTSVNTYSGNVTLNADGIATVTLPPSFEIVTDGEIRYVLTPIGEAAPDLHVSSPVENGSFEIGGGQPNMTVSWRIIARRAD